MQKNLLGPTFLLKRRSLHLTQDEVCSRLNQLGIGMDRTALSRIEWGNRTLTDIEMIGLVQVLELDPEEVIRNLLEGSGKKKGYGCIPYPC